MKNINIEILNLDELISHIEHLHPELVHAFKKSEISKKYRFYKAKYRYGDKILSKKDIYLSLSDGGSVCINNAEISKELQEDLQYDTKTQDPLALFLTKISEAYFHKKNVLHSSSLLAPGNFIGIPRALNVGNSARSTITDVEINAGCRSSFMLSKISHKNVYKKISKITGIDISVPTSYENHWPSFVDIANALNSEWCCEVIYFPRNFIEDLKTIELAPINVGLNNIHTKTYNIKHSAGNIWNLLYFAELEKDKLLQKNNLFYLDIVKHLFMLSANSAIGFQPATSDETAPNSVIQDFYKTKYGLENTLIMEPTTFNYKLPDQKPVYLSLNYQDIMTKSLDKSKKKTNLSILNEIQYLHNLYLQYIAKESSLRDSSLYELTKQVCIDHFHSYSLDSTTNHIINIENIFLEDERFSNSHADLESIKTAAFFRGGIRFKKI